MRSAELNRPSGTRQTLTLLAFSVWAMFAGLAASAMQVQKSPVGPRAGAQTVLRTARREAFLNGRRPDAQRSAAMALDLARSQHHAMLQEPRNYTLTASWTAVGPAQVASSDYGNVTGRVTSVVIDPADQTGNTIYIGTTGGGVWKSTNAAGPVSSVVFAPLTDTLPVYSANAGTSATPSLSIGALGVGGGVLLAGTGDPNDATDSYYGAGLLRSSDGGATWTLVQQAFSGTGSSSGTGLNASFVGLSFAGFAFSSLDPSLVVAAVSQAAEGDLVNAVDTTYSVKGLYYSVDAGVSWHMATVMDGNQVVQTPLENGFGGGNAATSIVWNAARQRFFAALRFHGYYESLDGQTWTRLSQQPGAGLTTRACPPNAGGAGSPACPIFRGQLAVQTTSGDTFALTVDGANRDLGLYQDVCGGDGRVCGGPSLLFGKKLDATPLETGDVSQTISQADYDLSLAAFAAGTDTILYVGTEDLFRCNLASGCALRNTTNAQGGCLNPAQVAPAQHSIAGLVLGGVPLIYLGNDGGVYRSSDGADEAGSPCSTEDASHFQNLNGGLGSLAEIASFAQDPSDPETLLVGLGALGSAGTGSASTTSAWTQFGAREGGTVAIDRTNPQLWYVSNGAGVNIARCTKGSNCTPADFAATTIGEAQVANDIAAIHAPWLLDPAFSADLLIGTCRMWRGPAADGAAWSSSDLLSKPFGAPAANGCSATFPVLRSLAAGGPPASSTDAPHAGSQVLYAGLAGTQDGGQGFGGHIFTTSSAELAKGTTIWTDLQASPVSNDFADSGLFNPGGFDVSSIAVDEHDASGLTVYATVMGFARNSINAPHVYRSIDGGAHWTNISSNLPNAPANSVIVDPNDANTVYVAMDTGVYVTPKVGSCVSGNVSANCWSIYGSSLPNAPVVALQAASTMPTGDGRLGELRAATYGRGIWQIPLLTSATPLTAGIKLDPASLVFQSQQVSTASIYVPVTVTNTGNAVLLVSSVITSGDFSETDDCAGQPIVQSATCTVQVSFLPTATGARNGVLTVYGNVAGGQATAALAGMGTLPGTVVLNPASLVFPPTSLGATSFVQNITISNTGTASSNLQKAFVTGDFKIAANTCGASLAADTGCTVSVAFLPNQSGTRSGTFTIVDDAGTQVANLIGTGTTPATDALSPLSLSFSGQQLNTTSATQRLTLVNAGDVALTLIAAQVTSGDFGVVNSCGNSLNAHSACTFGITFVPKRIGQQSGVLTLADQFRTQTVQLSGFGLAPPGVSLSPLDGLAFGSVGVGLNTPAQTVTLTNNGGVPLALSSVAVTGSFFIVTGSNTCVALLAPDSVCTVAIGFNPVASGSQKGTVTFTDDAANTPQTLALTGTGVDLALSTEGPTSITISSGQTATFTLLLKSPAGLIGNVNFTCSGLPALSLCTVNPPNPALGEATVVTVTVATGLANASMRSPALPWSRDALWLAMLLPVWGVMVSRRQRCGVLNSARVLGMWVFVASVLALGGCQAARTIPGNGVLTPSPPVITPSGTYGLLVAASSGGLVRTAELTLIVQ